MSKLPPEDESRKLNDNETYQLQDQNGWRTITNDERAALLLDHPYDWLLDETSRTAFKGANETKLSAKQMNALLQVIAEGAPLKVVELFPEYADKSVERPENKFQRARTSLASESFPLVGKQKGRQRTFEFDPRAKEFGVITRSEPLTLDFKVVGPVAGCARPFRYRAGDTAVRIQIVNGNDMAVLIEKFVLLVGEMKFSAIANPPKWIEEGEKTLNGSMLSVPAETGLDGWILFQTDLRVSLEAGATVDARLELRLWRSCALVRALQVHAMSGPFEHTAEVHAADR